MKKATRLFGFVMLAISLFIVAVPASAQDETGTVTFYAQSCPAAEIGEPGLFVADPVTGSNFPDGPLEGCVDATSTFTFEGADGTTVNHDTASGTISLPVGLYTITDQTSGLTVEANVAAGAETGILLVSAVDPAEEGTVEISSMSCPRAAGVFTSDAVNGNGIPADAEWYAGCVDSVTTLSFLQGGFVISQAESSAGGIILPAGEYVVRDESSGEDAIVHVVVGSPAAVYAQQHDGTALTGEVYLVADTCPGGSDAVDRLIVADPVVGSLMPEGEGAYDGCERIDAVFTFTDEAGKSSTYEVADKVAELPVGFYTIVEETTGLAGEVNVVNTAPSTVYLRLVADADVTPTATVAPTVAPTATPGGVTELPATGNGTTAIDMGGGVDPLVLAGSVVLAVGLVTASLKSTLRR